MKIDFPLSKTNRLKLAAAFRACQRVDFSIECAVEGQLGRAFVDDLNQPAAFCINVGPFWYYAGDASMPGARALMEDFPAYNLLMPSTPGWLELAQACFGDNLKSFPRYSFSSAALDVARLSALLENSPHCPAIVPITADLATALASLPDSYFDLSDFDSPEDFVERSFGFAALDQETVMGVAYGSLVCSQGIEVSVFVEEGYRRAGVATGLSSRLLLESLRRGLRPNWDAANLESCRLAEKLGYTPSGSYTSYYHTGK